MDKHFITFKLSLEFVLRLFRVFKIRLCSANDLGESNRHAKHDWNCIAGNGGKKQNSDWKLIFAFFLKQR